jgi:pyruvate dehydrogenase E1 component
MQQDLPGTGLLVVTSPDVLHRDWAGANRPGEASGSSHIERLLDVLPPDAPLVTVHDGHPAALSWLGAVRGQPLTTLGVERFGQCGDVRQLYGEYRIDAAAILDAAARLLLQRIAPERK